MNQKVAERIIRFARNPRPFALDTERPNGEIALFLPFAHRRARDFVAQLSGRQVRRSASSFGIVSRSFRDSAFVIGVLCWQRASCRSIAPS